MSYVLGLDLGTGSIKGLLMNRQGEVVQSKSADYPLQSLQPGYSEQNPQDWLNGAQTVMTELIQAQPDMLERLEGISFSGQMHSLVLLDEAEKVLRDAILWNDVRTTKQCQRIMGQAGEMMLDLTKNRVLEGFTLPKILWVQEHEPTIWQQVAHIMLPKDFLGWWLTGNYQMDVSDGAGTLMMDVEKEEWAEPILNQFGIAQSILPKLVSSSELVGNLQPELTALFGFKREVKVFAGGADNACGALGAGIVEEGIGMCSIGTSGVFLAFEEDAQKDYQGQLHLFNHVVKKGIYSMGVTLAAGHSLTWFKENFAEDLSYEELLTGIEELKPGADGLLFTPYIVGERTPYFDSQIRGSFIGLDTHHQQKHLARAVLEGITFSLKDSQMLMEEVAHKSFEKIVSVGGGAKNKAWLQMQADIFNAPVVTLTVEEGPGLGAAMLAAIGLGWFKDERACAECFISYQDEYVPIEENVKAYQKVYAIYRQVYEATRELSYQLQRLD